MTIPSHKLIKEYIESTEYSPKIAEVLINYYWDNVRTVMTNGSSCAIDIAGLGVMDLKIGSLRALEYKYKGILRKCENKENKTFGDEEKYRNILKSLKELENLIELKEAELNRRKAFKNEKSKSNT